MENRIIKGKYKVVKKLGQGAFGSAFKVLNTEDQKEYVLKEINLSDNPEENAQTENEGRLLAKINSEHVVRFYDSFIENNKYYLVMEYCDSNSLSHFIEDYKNQDRLIPERTVLDIFLQICLGLKEVHSHNIIHRDLKPDNVFISENLKIKIGDFGISKETEANKKYAQTVAGTLIYMSPEIVQGLKYTSKTDIWSMGCILYELCTLTYIFPALSQVLLINSIVNKKPKNIDSKFYGSELQLLIDQLLEKDPVKRPDIEETIKEVKKCQKKYEDSEYIIDNILDELLDPEEEVSISSYENTVQKTIQSQSVFEVEKDARPIKALKLIGLGTVSTAAAIIPGVGWLAALGIGSGLTIINKVIKEKKNKFINENFGIVIKIQNDLMNDIKKEINLNEVDKENIVMLSDDRFIERINALKEKLKEEKYKNKLKTKLGNNLNKKDILPIIINAMYIQVFTKNNVKELGKASAGSIQDFFGALMTIINGNDPRLRLMTKINNEKSLVKIYDQFNKALNKLYDVLKNKITKKNLEANNKDFIQSYYNSKPAEYKKKYGFEKYKVKVFLKIYENIDNNHKDIINNLFNQYFSSVAKIAIKNGLEKQFAPEEEHVLSEIYNKLTKG